MSASGAIKDSLVKYDSPLLLSEKNTSGSGDKSKKQLSSTSKKSAPKLPPVDQSGNKAQSQIEDILNSIISPK